MSTKDLFERNYLPDKTEKTAYSEIESVDNLKALSGKQQAFVPQVDYTDPQSFAKYGSAYLYYESALQRIMDFYPYDGSAAEINNFYNKSLDIEKYLFNNRYPRTNGYVVLSVDGWGTGTKSNDNYGLPATAEYITFKGGPNVKSQTGNLKDIIPDSSNSKFQYNNVYDENLYTNDGLPSDYGKGTRTSNLKSDFDTGVTVEFWTKTGSLATSISEKQVIFDAWNNALSSSADYGRITIELNATASNSPWLITVQSGATSVFQQTVGTNVTLNSLEDWKHYAFTLSNTGSDFQIELYVDGELDDTETISSTTINELNPRNMVGRIGGLLTAPSGSADATLVDNYIGGGKLSGSMDEFRFWKVRRTAKDIGKNWFAQVRGGTNTDIANTTLGLYYKFNEGITATSSIDSVVLDYGGRICNGTWTGYGSNSRNTGSAIVSASAAASEYLDPIIYSNHTDVASLRTELLNLGTYHDGQNTSRFLNLIPSWVIEETAEDDNSDLEKLSHIIGAYFDKMYLQISALPKFKHLNYPSSSHTPLPFSEHLPASLGLLTPEIFIDSTVTEKFANRTDTTIFEQDLQETKNLIYQNIYNNIASIYKSKGTERSIRNVLRCFNIDDNLIYLNAYANNQTYELQNNLVQTQKRKRQLNFNESTSTSAVVYQANDPAYSGETLGYISGSGTEGLEDKYGFTLEASTMFPKFFRSIDKVDRSFTEVSLFGMQTVNSSSTENTAFLTGAQDNANFQVFAVRDAIQSKNVYFKLTSSIDPHPFDALTSSLFHNVYDNENWNFSVAVKPSNFPYADVVSGSSDYTYDVVFRGYNNKLGTINNQFEVSSSVSKAVGQAMLRAGKRVYVGARNTNITGSNLTKSDVLFNSAKYWTKFIDSYTLKQHALDRENHGISGSYRNISALDSLTSNQNSYNFNTLAMNWYFNNVTSSDGSGNFFVTDLSSGSANIRDNFGWSGKIAGYMYTGKGTGFLADSTAVAPQKIVSEFKFVDPEQVVSSDMVKILSEDDELFGLFDEVPNYVFTIEKSIYKAISEEILDFFAGVIDFNNVIGDPVHRYRMEYKPINHLRNIFFQRFSNINTVEKFTEYFKWFDDALANIIEQLVPASADMVPDVYNTIESHVLERNKYQTPFPTIEFKNTLPGEPTPGGSSPAGATTVGITGIGALGSSYSLDSFGGVESSPRPTNLHKNFWKKKARPGAAGVGDFEISSGDATVDAARTKIRDVMWKKPVLSGTMPTLSTVAGVKYQKNIAIVSLDGGVVDLKKVDINKTIKGGVNFEHNKSIDYTYSSLRPAGPINTNDGVFVPQNVLFAETIDLEPIDTVAQWNEEGNVGKKRKRHLKVIQGRDYVDGQGYAVNKNSFSFPFNVMSASIPGGIDKLIRARTEDNLTITNLHNDVYGPEMEQPMQGPFTNYAVGGHQSRHVPLNKSATGKSALQLPYYNGLDDYTTRPEAWKILIGKCSGIEMGSGAIGMVAPDYPWPEANDRGVPAYPLTASQKAYLYRDHIAKRPVNVRNIRMRTGSTILGNFERNYEVVHSFGAYANPRNFIENQPVLPTVIFSNKTTASTQTRTFLDLRRNVDGHFQFVSDYNVGYLSGTINKSIITTRFAAPGGIEVSTHGYRDFRASEFSVYNSLNHRNSTVIRRQQTPSGAVSEPTGVGTPGIRVFDIHGRDFGLTSHYARHTAKFGRDSNLVADSVAGASYIQSPGFHKTHRNNLDRVEVLTETLEPIRSGSTLVNTEALYFNDTVGKGFMLINADSASAQTFITSSRADGFSYSGWIRFAPDDDVGYILSAGKMSAGSDSYLNIFKDRQSSEERLYVNIRTRASNPSGTSAIAKFYAATNAVDDGDFHHFVVTVPADSGTRIGSAIGIYVDGSPATVVTQSAPQEFFDTTGDSGTYNVRGKVTRTADTCLALGGGSSETGVGGATNSPFSGSMDQVSLWLGTLTAEDVSELYNGGTPCDVTSSTPYANADTELFAWYRFGSGSQNDIIGSNNGVFSSGSNAIFNWDPDVSRNLFPISGVGTSFTSDLSMSSTEHPTPLAGCTPQIVGYKTVRTFHTASTFDNFFVSHQIPRSTKQYSWITKSVVNTHNESGFVSPDFTRRVSSSTGITYEDSYDFVSASQVGTAIASGERRFPALSEEGFLPQISRLNLNIVDPLSSSTNTMGHAITIPLGSTTETDTQYVNAPELVRAVAESAIPDAFNMLMIKRNGYYGNAGWQQARRQDHQLLMHERRNNKLSVQYRNGDLQKFDLFPVSAKGRPVRVNLDYINMVSTSAGGIQRTAENITFKTSYNNEMVLFQEQKLNDFVEVNFDSEVTAFEQLVAMKDRNNIQLNWILYSENVFPSTRNEFRTQTSERTNYDNLFWRDTQADRIALGVGRANSLGVTGSTDTNSTAGNFTESLLSQSVWPLDAPSDFETRTSPPVVTIERGSTGLPTSDDIELASLVVSNSAGELQNTYSTYTFANSSSVHSFNLGQTDSLAVTVRNSALYARKHMMNSPLSVRPNASIRNINGINVETLLSYKIPTGSGEAKWEAATQAGYLTTSNGRTSFVSSESKPFYNNYDSFKQDIKSLAKGYAVVPEFRVSEQIENYTKFGIQDGENFDIFEIPGTELSSSQDTFYKDFSNSDFLRNFADIKKMSDLSAKEIKLTCHAAIKFNPYKGFYPAQRSLDLVSQFSKSYGDSVEVLLNTGKGPDPTGLDSLREFGDGTQDGRQPIHSALARSVIKPLFAPGILYNSIKSGMAVDYPISTNGYKFISVNVTGALLFNPTENHMLTTSDATGSQQYVSGAFWDIRLPFETIIDPSKTMRGLVVPEQEPHPSQSFGSGPRPLAPSSSIASSPADKLYSMMASNYFAEVGKFFLKEGGYTRLQSNGVSLSTFKFGRNEVYGARLRMKTSFSGSRTYTYESGSNGDYGFFATDGARAVFKNSDTSISSVDIQRSGTFEIPQDPTMNPRFIKNFTMYDRASGFGPPVAGREFGSISKANNNGTSDLFALSASAYGVKDSMNGHNWSFTPPYYDGEAWVDFIFRPSASVEYDLQRILAETQIVKRRFDPGPDLPGHKAQPGVYRRTLIRDNDLSSSISGALVASQNFTPYASENINHNAMQIDSAVNLFGVENVIKRQLDKFGNEILSENSIVGQRWVIQPKFETPMMNFYNASKATAGFGDEATPKGMWHQFGRLPSTTSEGIFLEIDDIPAQWLTNHYEVVTGSSVYNNYTAVDGPKISQQMKSFSNLMGFTDNNSKVRLGQLAEKQTIKEAIVAVPYIVEGIPANGTLPSNSNAKTRKQFIYRRRFYTVN